MSKQLKVLVELTIAGKRVPDVKAQMPAIIEKVKHHEPGMLSYEWYIDEAEGKCYIIEEFRDAAAWLAHLENMEDTLPALFAIAPLTRWEAFGTVPQEVKEVVLPLGAVLHTCLAGFKR